MVKVRRHTFRAMELIRILNRCHRPGFVDQHVSFSTDKKTIEVTVRPDKDSAEVSSWCHLPAHGYGQLAERRFDSSENCPFCMRLYAVEKVAPVLILCL
jgi:hypothetical protein